MLHPPARLTEDTPPWLPSHQSRTQSRMAEAHALAQELTPCRGRKKAGRRRRPASQLHLPPRRLVAKGALPRQEGCRRQGPAASADADKGSRQARSQSPAASRRALDDADLSDIDSDLEGEIAEETVTRSVCCSLPKRPSLCA